MRLIFLFGLLLIAISNWATHNRAGEIIYKHISGNTYEFTITTYTYTLSLADRDTLYMQVGDEAVIKAPRDTQVFLNGTTYYWNIYTATYTFASSGTYEIVVEDPNRNLGVKNIPNSVYIPFSIRTVMLINPDIGFNNAPELLSPPIHKAALNRVFTHNPITYDVEGDSLSYRFTNCTGANGQPIPSYKLPEASDHFIIDAKTGKMEWDSPLETGAFNVAIAVDEWRNGVKIGSITRDMQIEVLENDNYPPIIDDIDDYCIRVGDTLEFEFEIIDNEENKITCIADGGPFRFGTSKPEFNLISSEKGKARYHFKWAPGCDYVRDKPYTIVFTAEDDYYVVGRNNIISDFRLADSEDFLVKVLGPPPINIEIQPFSNAISLAWQSNICKDVSYAIYRDSRYIDFKPDSCTNGVPDSIGYALIDVVKDTSYFDNNKEKGLPQGYEYCYIITAVYGNGSHSIASEIICSYLTPPVPNIIKTSVTKVDDENGEISLAWIKPTHLDTLGFFGPFKYKIYRGNTLWGTSFNLIDSIETADLNDTTYLDFPGNTLTEYPYSYFIELYNNGPGNIALIGNPAISSTLYADFEASSKQLKLLFKRNVPWVNKKYIVYRQDNPFEIFDSIGIALDEFYIDSNLINGKEYCYQLKSEGNYKNNNGDLYSTENLSHVTCGIPIDTVPPAAPLLTVVQNCDSSVNNLAWQNRSTEGLVNFILYYRTDFESKFDSILFAPEINFYKHVHQNSSSYCYFIVAVDSSNLRSMPSNMVCVDLCLSYVLPNVFTPNNDEKNDIFIPITIDKAIEKVDMKIFNRWGQVVFVTSDPKINWNGLHMETKKLVPPGVYYYICDAYARSVSGLKPYNFIGFINVYMEKGMVISPE